jgi:transcriptional regulator with XRE-family HTH domain
VSKGKKVKALPTPNLDEDISLELIAKTIKAKRTQLGLDTKTAAMLCGVSLVTLNKVENASYGVRFDSVLKILKALGIKLKIIWDNE